VIFTVLQQFNNYTLLEILLELRFIQNLRIRISRNCTKCNKYAKEKGFDTVIVDTAGRLAVDTEMMDEISRAQSNPAT
jgi:signal recognition particle GTPase